MSAVAVVLAGGASRRYGADKLAADVGGRPLLDRTVAGLPDDLDVVVVGPERALSRPVTWVREDPPGGGPVAGLVAGLRAAGEADLVVVVPGDAPYAGAGVAALRGALGPAAAAVAVDPAGREQVLQLALDARAVRRLLALAGDGQDAAVRPLVLALDPVRVPLPAAQTYDVDTPQQHAALPDG